MTKYAIPFDFSNKKQKNYAWAALIKKVYGISPLICKNCGGEMKVVSVITDFKVIKKILKHLGLLNKRNHSPPPLPNTCAELVSCIHPPLDIDPIGDMDKYFQDDIPTDDMYLVDHPFSP